MSKEKISEPIAKTRGRNAYEAGEDVCANPYSIASKEYGFWERGWYASQTLRKEIQNAEVVDLSHLPTDHPDHPYQNGHWDETCDMANPKDVAGSVKAPMDTVPAGVLMELGVAMLEGSRKYGRHNYRQISVKASSYYSAHKRHMDAWWEGEEEDPQSQISHITKAIATLVVLRDAQMMGMLNDDRPPPLPEGWLEKLNEKAAEIVKKHPDPKPPVTKNKD